MRSIKQVIGAAVAAVVCSFSAAAVAQPATADSFELGAGFRYGIATDLEAGDDNPWAIGLGVNGGYTLPNALYLGGNFEYFFGQSYGDDFAGDGANIWQVTAEAGYDLPLGPIAVLRPKLGAGVAKLQDKLCINGDCATDSQADFTMLPGVTLIVMPPGFRLSADIRYQFIFASDAPHAIIFTLGIGF
jgi:Outer membrane protein beta-barrel domain